jgi:hypothetical protein
VHVFFAFYCLAKTSLHKNTGLCCVFADKNAPDGEEHTFVPAVEGRFKSRLFGGYLQVRTYFSLFIA